MTLLDATATVIDHCKSTGPENDRILAGAVKRLEKRLRLLQLRRAKQTRWNRHKAFWWAIGEVGGGADMKRLQGVLICRQCKIELDFGQFLKSAILTGHGKIKTFICPACSTLLIGAPPPDEDILQAASSPASKPLPTASNV